MEQPSPPGDRLHERMTGRPAALPATGWAKASTKAADNVR